MALALPTDFNGVLNALKKGHHRRVLAAVAALSLDVLDPSPPQQSLLVEAIQCRQWPVVHALIGRGVSVNGRARADGESVLMSACRAHRLRLVADLLARGADPSVERTGHDGVFQAVLGGQSGRVHEIETRRGSSVEIAAVAADTLALFRLLLDAGAPVNGSPTLSVAPLMSVAQLSMLPLAELLLAHGADPARANAAGNTAFMFAARDAAGHGNPLLLQRLLEAGAAPSVQNKEGETAEDFYQKETDFMVLRGLSPQPWATFYAGEVLAADLSRRLPAAPADARSRLRL